MTELRSYLATFILNSDVLDLCLVVLVVVLISAILGALGLDIFNPRR